MDGGREFFDLLEEKIKTPKIVRKKHLNKAKHYEYGKQYNGNRLVFDDISDKIRSVYNPFESCASAQILIKKEGKK